MQQTPEADSHYSEMLSEAQAQADYYTQSLWYKCAEETHSAVARQLSWMEKES